MRIPPQRSRAVIFGCAGPELSEPEFQFFRAANPVGFILFQRNCQSPDQVRRLVTALRESIGNARAPVLIDQEGGRVQRLKPPHWPVLPAGGALARLAETDPDAAVDAARLHGRLLAADLEPLGITVDCAPVLDVLQPETHDVIGNRALGDTPEQVARLGAAMCRGLLAGGVLPVIKHVPGHGRTRVDTHHALPVVDAPLDELMRTDFEPFRALSAMPWAMTAHMVFSAIDATAPVTQSESAIRRIIRGRIGFGGILVSDDIGMQALSGSFRERAKACLAAGCDLVLHCSGDMGEMVSTLEGTRPIRGATAAWLTRAETLRRRSVELGYFDRVAGLDDLNRMLEAAGQAA